MPILLPRKSKIYPDKKLINVFANGKNGCYTGFTHQANHHCGRPSVYRISIIWPLPTWHGLEQKKGFFAGFIDEKCSEVITIATSLKINWTAKELSALHSIQKGCFNWSLPKSRGTIHLYCGCQFKDYRRSCSFAEGMWYSLWAKHAKRAAIGKGTPYAHLCW